MCHANDPGVSVHSDAPHGMYTPLASRARRPPPPGRPCFNRLDRIAGSTQIATELSVEGVSRRDGSAQPRGGRWVLHGLLPSTEVLGDQFAPNVCQLSLRSIHWSGGDRAIPEPTTKQPPKPESQKGTSPSTSSIGRSIVRMRMPFGEKPKRSSGEKMRRKSCGSKNGSNF